MLDGSGSAKCTCEFEPGAKVTMPAKKRRREAEAAENAEGAGPAPRGSRSNGGAAPSDRPLPDPVPDRPDPSAAATAAAVVEGSDSEDEGIRNAIGDVPLEWYDDYDHIGYGVDGQRLARPARRDELDALLERYDKGSSRAVYDALHGELVELTDEDVNLIRRIQRNDFPHPSFDPYPDYVDWAVVEDNQMPLWAKHPPKSSFLPSVWERKRINRLVRAMRTEAWAKQEEAERRRKEAQRPDYNYAIWDETLEDLTRAQRRMHKRLLAPKLPPPGNAESYNPPSEYLFTKDEEDEWHSTDPEDRDLGFVPRKYDSLRRVPAYDNLVQERFQRCLDLYLCPRTQRTRLNIEPDSLIPELPDLAQLEPYPKRLRLSFQESGEQVRTLSVHPAGQWLATGADDGQVRLWEVATGRCVLEWTVARDGDVLHRVTFAPAPERSLLAVSVGARVLLLVLPMPGASRAATVDDAAVGLPPKAAGPTVLQWAHEKVAPPVWLSGALRGDATEAGGSTGDGKGRAALAAAATALVIPHAKAARCVAWHPRCDYLATVVPDGGAKAVLLHQVSRRVTQQPFAKSRGRVETVAFHQSRPHLFVATERHVRIYDLVKQALLKKLQTGVQLVSCMAVHPSGDNLLVGSYDKRVLWFDLDLSTQPCKVLRSHELAVRAVAFHPTLPLFASASDDLGVQVCHGQVFDDIASNALIVPLRRIAVHKATPANLGVLDCTFHPHQPWLFSCGADGGVHLYT